MCGGEFSPFFNDKNRERILRGTFDSYYAEAPEVVFDTNRSWTGRLALLKALYPQSKMICCVRELSWIVDSIERLLIKNPLQLTYMFNYKPGNSVYSRTEALMNSEAGVIGAAWSTLNEAWFGPDSDRLIIVPYENLVKNPTSVINKLYAELGEQPFVHDFNNVSYTENDYDDHIGMPGLHVVKKKVEYKERKPVIPVDLFNKYISTAFWNTPEHNLNNVKVLK
jgi:sulfotransferase